MPIVIVKPEVTLAKVGFKIPSDLLTEIKAYCEAFKVENLSDFFCQSAQYVLKTDRDWNKIHNQKFAEKN